MSNYDNSNSNGGVGTMSSKSLVENSALREAENEDIRNQIAKVKKQEFHIHIHYTYIRYPKESMKMERQNKNNNNSQSNYDFT